MTREQNGYTEVLLQEEGMKIITYSVFLKRTKTNSTPSSTHASTSSMVLTTPERNTSASESAATKLSVQ